MLRVHLSDAIRALLSDPWNLDRFLNAQELVWTRVVGELCAGEKRSHWMWFVFPQLASLGASADSRYYGLSGRDEAEAYAKQPVLWERLTFATSLLLDGDGASASAVFGSLDDLKFRSCMTLFAEVADDPTLFIEAIRRLCGGEQDGVTLELLGVPPQHQASGTVSRT